MNPHNIGIFCICLVLIYVLLVGAAKAIQAATLHPAQVSFIIIIIIISVNMIVHCIVLLQ